MKTINTTNQVRQILMNELGLTREYVRSEVASIVEETTKKHLNHLEAQGVIANIIYKLIRNDLDLNPYHSGLEEMRETIASHILDRLWEDLRPRISILPMDPGTIPIWEPLKDKAKSLPWSSVRKTTYLIRWAEGEIETISHHPNDRTWKRSDGTEIKDHHWDRITHFARIPKFDGDSETKC